MNWKGNVGNSSVNEDAEVTEQFKIWIDAASSIFGGLEICALDLVHDQKTDSFKILELNGTAIGLVRRHENEDMNMMRDLVVTAMSKLYDRSDDIENCVKDEEQKDGEIDEEEKEEVALRDDREPKIEEKYVEMEKDVERGNDTALLNAIAKIRDLEKDNGLLKEQVQNKDTRKGCLMM